MYGKIENLQKIVEETGGIGQIACFRNLDGIGGKEGAIEEALAMPDVLAVLDGGDYLEIYGKVK